MVKYTKRVQFEPVRNPERFQYDPAFIERGIREVLGRIRKIIPDFVHQYPSAASEGLVYSRQDNTGDWVNGFWTGMLWLSYELSGDALFRAVAEAQYDDYELRLQNNLGLAHHDIGFLYIPSILAQYKLTGSPKAKQLCLKAADRLAGRFSERAGIIQVRDSDTQGVFIVDCCMNIPLLFWAAKETGERSYYLKALSHISQVCSYMIREDASTFQRYKIDEVTGQPCFGSQGQGYNDDSCWSRGQAWAIYGLALAYRYTQEPEFLAMAQRLAHYFLNRLPQDDICCWDLIFTGDNDPRDSSAAPIAACGLLEIEGSLSQENPLRRVYHNAAAAMLMNLTDGYLTPANLSNGLLMHGVYCKKDRPGKEGSGHGDDECCIWGDYFYLEGLRRMQREWNPYW
ncbi:MAG: glucuronyl hydrolase [Provencibacterium sp.]|jgi:unsaturated chondroitin disaccharide hydrolase|nr:glucuronyl hydrolase [Provencibacterium sp.]